MMKSQVKILAGLRGIKTPQELSYEARITWPTAKKVWAGDLSTTWLETSYKVSRALGCNIEDLFVSEPNQETIIVE